MHVCLLNNGECFQLTFLDSVFINPNPPNTLSGKAAIDTECSRWYVVSCSGCFIPIEYDDNIVQYDSTGAIIDISISVGFTRWGKICFIHSLWFAATNEYFRQQVRYEAI